MKNILYVLKFIGLFIWQLPQNILVLLMLLWFFMMHYDTKFMMTKRCSFVFKTKGVVASVSLGSFVFIKWKRSDRKEIIQHELGHVWWSHVFGPLYLIIIGLPSLLWNILRKGLGFVNYYEFYTEKWANKKGGVIDYEIRNNVFYIKVIKDILS